MKKYLLVIFYSFCFTQQYAQKLDLKDINKFLQKFQKTWNRGDTCEFMKNFEGQKYKTPYYRYNWAWAFGYGYCTVAPNKTNMGILLLDSVQFTKVGDGFLVKGNWFLKRTKADLSGAFELSIYSKDKRLNIIRSQWIAMQYGKPTKDGSIYKQSYTPHLDFLDNPHPTDCDTVPEVQKIETGN